MSVGLLIAFLGVVVLGRTVFGGLGKRTTNWVAGRSGDDDGDDGGTSDDSASSSGGSALGDAVQGLGDMNDKLLQTIPGATPAAPKVTPRAGQQPGTRGKLTNPAWGHIDPKTGRGAV